MKLNVMAASHAMCKLSSSLVLQPVVVLLSCVLGPEKLPMMGHLEQKKESLINLFLTCQGPVASLSFILDWSRYSADTAASQKGQI